MIRKCHPNSTEKTGTSEDVTIAGNKITLSYCNTDRCNVTKGGLEGGMIALIVALIIYLVAIFILICCLCKYCKYCKNKFGLIS